MGAPTWESEDGEMDRREVALGLTRIAVENVFVLHGEEPEIKTVLEAHGQASEEIIKTERGSGGKGNRY